MAKATDSEFVMMTTRIMGCIFNLAIAAAASFDYPLARDPRSSKGTLALVVH